ncbi:MAG: septum site-determining protein MinC, partial [Lachnospiraceae bacterium]
YRGDLHRGESLESEASIVIIGDVRHGARVSAKGNIIVLGQLRGSVHAGVAGNGNAMIVAMEMAPLQLKIEEVSAITEIGDEKSVAVQWLLL